MDPLRTVRLEQIEGYEHLKRIYVIFRRNYGEILGVTFNTNGMVYMEFAQAAFAQHCAQVQIWPSATLLGNNSGLASEYQEAARDLALSTEELVTMFSLHGFHI